jgi:hypothetical protein
MRRYHGFLADSARWERFALRPDDVIISTPSKCGTTWMQTIVGMLLLDRLELGAPMGELSPWIDMLTRDEAALFARLDGQSHRRFLKTHTPLDGLPWRNSVTYLTVMRHPLDAALSNRDHVANTDRERMAALRTAASGEPDPDERRVEVEVPTDPAAYLRWWIDSDRESSGKGSTNLAEVVHQAATYWDAREHPNVHLFHYTDLSADRDREMRRVAAALDRPIDEVRWPAFVAAASLDAMRDRADDLAPEADLAFWRSTGSFFHSGRFGAWTDLLSPDDVAHFERRLHALAGDPELAAWIVNGSG